MIQFDTLNFRRTLWNYFGQFVCIEKRVTIVVAFHFMKRRLKIGSNLRIFMICYPSVSAKVSSVISCKILCKNICHIYCDLLQKVFLTAFRKCSKAKLLIRCLLIFSKQLISYVIVKVRYITLNRMKVLDFLRFLENFC